MRRPITNKIVIHHSASDDWGQEETIKKFTQWHKSRGLAHDGNPAYHVLIGKDWQALVRPYDTVGYHSGNWAVNLSSLAICLVGNFDDETLTKYQEKKLSDQIFNWENDYSIKKILFHRDVKPTSCPGKNITHEYIDELLGGNLLNRVNLAFRQVFKRQPDKHESHYYQKRVTTKNPFRKIKTYYKLLDVMNYWKSEGKTQGK